MVEKKLVDLISTALGVPSSQITEETNSTNLKEWDSLGHLKIVLEMENSFGVRFSSDEIPSLTSLKKIKEALSNQQSIQF